MATFQGNATHLREAMKQDVDIEQNRKDRKWSKKELIKRVLWAVAQPLFRYSPRLCWGWRNALLHFFGAKLGKAVRIDPTARIFIPWNLAIGDFSSVGSGVYLYNLGHLSVGKQVTISHGAHLCGGTHDYTSPRFTLIKSAIVVHDNSWVCADAFVGPGVIVGEGAVVGARAVATRHIEPWTVVAGNPMKVVGKRALQ